MHLQAKSPLSLVKNARKFQRKRQISEEDDEMSQSKCEDIKMQAKSAGAHLIDTALGKSQAGDEQNVEG